MKFQRTALFTFLLVTGAAHGQQVNFGIKAGGNLSNIHNDNSSQNDIRGGVHAGLLGHIHINRHTALQPELIYSLQGANYTASGINTKVKLAYLNIPVLLQYMFNNGFRMEVGPQLGFLVNAHSESSIAKLNIKDNLNTVDLALAAGIGYVHTPSGIGVDARYNFGVSNINKNGPVKSYNRVFQAGLFYLFKHR